MTARATIPDRQDIGDDTPITLLEACELYGNRFTPWTLRAEAGRGRLDIFRLGKRNYTTPGSLREMVRKCQDAARRQGSTSIPSDDNGSSEMDQLSAARAALNQTVAALKDGSLNTSDKSTSRSATRRR